MSCKTRAIVVAAALLMLAVAQAGSQEQGEPSDQATTIAAAGDAARAWNQQIAGFERAGSLRLASSRGDTLIDGRVHDRFDQYYGGARVFGAQLVRQRGPEGTISVFGRLHLDIDLDPEPRLSSSEALNRCRALTGVVPNGANPELVVLPLDGGGYALAYYLSVWTGRDAIALFIDAKTGDELLRYSELMRQAAVGNGHGVLGDRKKVSVNRTGGAWFADDELRPPTIRTFDMQGDLQRTEELLAGRPPSQSDIASDTDNDWTDGAVVDAHVYLGYTYDYLFKRFNRRGIDDRNRPILTIVHPVSRNDFARYLREDEEVINLFFLNAFWCGSCGPDRNGMMMFGEGLPPNVANVEVDYLAAAIDVVAHELTHGLTQYTSGLIGRNESGALNEGFSDIIGIAVEFFFQLTGSGPLRAEYTVGEDFVRPPTALVRSAANPAQFGDPDHYARRYTGTEDAGGIHINLTILTHAYYLAIEGGTNRTSNLSVQGVGGANREQIERVFYRAFTQFLPPTSNFALARQATLQAATDLYGSSSAAFRAVSQAWDAVGVR